MAKREELSQKETPSQDIVIVLSCTPILLSVASSLSLEYNAFTEALLRGFYLLALSLSSSLSLSLSDTLTRFAFDIALLESCGKDVGELVDGRLAHSLVHLSAHTLRDVSIGARLLCYRTADGSSDAT